jgi:hypothetical protein
MTVVAKIKEISGDFDDGTLGDEPVLWGLEKTVSWRLAWQRAVAKAWAIDDYKARLLDPTTTHLALKEVGWEVPEGLEIEIKAAHGIEWDENISQYKIVNGKTGEEVAANGWAYEVDLKAKKVVFRKSALLKALKTKVIMMLPPEPSKKDVEFSPLALADYDGLSRAYPFTCCTAC